MRSRFILAAAAALAVSGTAGAGAAEASAPVATPVTAAAACADFDIVAARGTFEPGTLGTIVGDPVASAIKGKLLFRSVSTYAVNYPASLDLTSATTGNIDLVNHVQSQAVSCPNEKFILVGYSQGANVVSNSLGISSDGAVVGAPIAATLPGNVEPKIAAVVVFGPPIGKLGKHITGTYQSRTKEFCAAGDVICDPVGLDVLAHLSYGGSADDAANFVATKV
jgi:cutinase